MPSLFGPQLQREKNGKQSLLSHRRCTQQTSWPPLHVSSEFQEQPKHFTGERCIQASKTVQWAARQRPAEKHSL